MLQKNLKKNLEKVSIAKNNQEIASSCNWVFLAVTPPSRSKNYQKFKI